MSNVPAGMTESDWHEARKAGIGGSDAAAVCGVSRYRTPLQVYLDKTGQAEPRELSEAAYWGNTLEPVVANEYHKRTGTTVLRNPEFLSHPLYPWMVASIDGVVEDGELGEGGFEAKTASLRFRAEWTADDIPDDYYFQVQHYMAVTDFAFFDVAVLIGGQEFIWKRIPRDLNLIPKLIEREDRFWHDHVLAGVPPVPMATAGDADAVRSMYPEGVAEEVALPAEAELLLRQRNEFLEHRNAAEAELLGIENKLKAMLGTSEHGTAGPFRVNWTTSHPVRVDTKRLKAEYPDVAEAVSYSKPQRRFSVSEVE